MSDLRAKILNADDQRSRIVDCPEWDCKVEVRSLTGAQRAAFMDSAFDAATGKPDFSRIHATLIIQTCFDPETGERVFEDTDRDALNSKSAAVTERIAKAAMELAGLAEQAAVNVPAAVEAGKGV